VKAVGKSKAMELILTGDMMDAHEAKSLGLVSRVVEKDKLLEEAQKMAEKIAGFLFFIRLFTTHCSHC
jgi:enoyl-CoA hydratase/carnithine racemase